MFQKLLTSLAIVLTIISGVSADAFVTGTQNSWENQYLSGDEAIQDGRYKEAEKALQSALSAAGSDEIKKITTLEALVELYDIQDNFAAKEEALLSMVRLMQDANYPLLQIADAYLQLSVCNFFLRQFENAELYAKKAIPMLEKTCGAMSPTVAVGLNNLGWLEYLVDNMGEAEAHFRQALYILRKSLGQKSLLYGVTASNLAQLYAHKGSHKDAYIWYQRAGRAFNASLGPRHVLSRQVERRRQEEYSRTNKQNKVKDRLAETSA